MGPNLSSRHPRSHRKAWHTILPSHSPGKIHFLPLNEATGSRSRTSEAPAHTPKIPVPAKSPVWAESLRQLHIKYPKHRFQTRASPPESARRLPHKKQPLHAAASGIKHPDIVPKQPPMQSQHHGQPAAFQDDLY